MRLETLPDEFDLCCPFANDTQALHGIPPPTEDCPLFSTMVYPPPERASARSCGALIPERRPITPRAFKPLSDSMGRPCEVSNEQSSSKRGSAFSIVCRLCETILRENVTRFLVVLFAASALLLSACEIPETPHAVGAISDNSCNECHRDGNYGAKAIDHPDRRHCVSCHDVSEYRPVPHSLETTKCIGCHAQGGGSIPKSSHADRSDCGRCHASSK